MKNKNHTSHIALHSSQKGITLIALIITIIVMLILVGVTINVALNGGLFSKAEEAGTKTKIAQIQEAVMIKKAEVLAEYDGKAPADYGITIADLNLPEQLKNEFSGKLIISKEADLYYDESVVTDTSEQNTFETMGIQAYVETPEPIRVPFTNYIENGNNYYISGDKNSTNYKVVTFSEKTSTFTMYNVNDGQVSEQQEYSNISFELKDKSELYTRLGITDEMMEQMGLAMGISKDEMSKISDDIAIWNNGGRDVVNVFMLNYTKAAITNLVFTLDTTYEFPS